MKYTNFNKTLHNNREKFVVDLTFVSLKENKFSEPSKGHSWRDSEIDFVENDKFYF